MDIALMPLISTVVSLVFAVIVLDQFFARMQGNRFGQKERASGNESESVVSWAKYRIVTVGRLIEKGNVR